jgi:hypothetical protein
MATGMHRSRYYRSFRGTPPAVWQCQVFIEQIGPHDWRGSVCEEKVGTVITESRVDEVKTEPQWDKFTSLSENGVKKAALITIRNRYFDREGHPG